MWLLSNNLGRVFLNAQIFGPPPLHFPRCHPTAPSPCRISRIMSWPPQATRPGAFSGSPGLPGPSVPSSWLDLSTKCLSGQWRVLCRKCSQQHKSPEGKLPLASLNCSNTDSLFRNPMWAETGHRFLQFWPPRQESTWGGRGIEGWGCRQFFSPLTLFALYLRTNPENA